ncbi:MAG: ROK family protein [Clostridia bacterium]|nr:ROK family protein [Clostridia bacterium]
MKKVIFACDIGGSKLLCGLVTPEGEIIDKEATPFPGDVTTDIIEEYIMSFYTKLTQRNPKFVPYVCGMTIPGLANAAKGIWVYACFSGISDYPIVERMSKKLDMPVYIENDVNACAFAEKVFGACRDCDDFLWMTVSNGVGGGLVLEGKVYGGAFGGSGEIGHVIVEDNGPVCPCGHLGCMEAVAAGPGIARRYEVITGKWLSAKDISDLARQGDETAMAVMAKTGEYIGKGLGKAASLLNLRRYVLGGGVMQSFDLMEPYIREAFAKEAFASPNKNAEIITTALKYEAGLMGATAIALR